MDVATRSGSSAAAAATGTGGGVSAIVEYDYTGKEPDELDLVKGAMIHSIKQMPGGWWEGTLQATNKTGMFPDNFVRIIDVNDDNTVTLRDKSATTNRRCKVIFSYQQVNDDELSLAVGDVIEFLGEVEEGWWRGRLKNKIGVFPSNFVIAIESSPIFASKRPTTGTTTTSNSLGKSSGSSLSSAASTTAASTAASTTKKTNRLSYHSSKEDLLTTTTYKSSASTTSNNSSNVSSTSAAASTSEDVAPILPPKPQRDYCRVEFPYAPQNDDELELKVGDIIAIISMELPDKGWWKGELRGKVGVFPDNFVKLLQTSEVSPLNDSQQSHRTAKSSSNSNSTTSTAAAAAANTAISATPAANITSSSNLAPAVHTNLTTSKVVIKKSGSTSSSQSSNRKDSFGSRDSLNDILSETGLQTGNVAAQRKSLENKNLDLRKQQLSVDTKTANNISATTTISTNSELRKSLENMDDKQKTPPPVLTKKPTIPSKKSTTVTSVAGNIFSGLKQKVKNVENKLTTAASHDYADGVGSSKMSPSGLPDSGPGGNIVMRRAATIAVEDTDFDKVERASILPDMRAGRVKAPKRRPPSAAINAIGESNNNNSMYMNGSNGSADFLNTTDENKPLSSDDNSTGEEQQLAKPKPREWEKKKAPWMEELKASQVKKKTSPNVEPRTMVDRTSKLMEDSLQQQTTTNAISSSSSSKVQSSSITSSSLMQQSMVIESSSSNSSQSVLRKESSISGATIDAMSKSMNNKLSNDIVTTTIDDVRASRPNSLSIRNRSISPSQLPNSAGRTSLSSQKSSASPAPTSLLTENATASSNSNNVNAASNFTTAKTSTAASSTSIVNNHHYQHENNIPTKTHPADSSVGGASSGSSSRVVDLEKRVEKLEAMVHCQQRTIEDLVRTLREETDRVKTLRGELDKYAQCVTQV